MNAELAVTPADPARYEVLVCKTCEQPFLRVKVRGVKPKTCPDCKRSRLVRRETA